MNADPLVACLERINVCLNWHRMHRERWPISVSQITSQTDLAKLYMPWYLDPNEAWVDYAHEAAKPMRVCEAAKKIGRLPIPSQRIVAKYAAIFQASKRPIQLMLPVYRLSSEASLLLDGNHRVVALAIVKPTFELTLALIDGPVEADALPDLKHWEF